MAARFRPKKYTFVSSAAVSLFTALGSSINDKYGQNLAMRAETDNAGRIFFGDAAGNFGGYLEAREAISIDLTGGWVSTADIYLTGSTGDSVYLTVLG